MEILKRIGRFLSPSARNDQKLLAEEMKSHADNMLVAGRKPTAEDSSTRVFERAGMTFVGGSSWLLLPSRFENRIFITVGEPDKLGSLIWVVVRPIRKTTPLISLSFESIEYGWNYLFIPDRKTAYACRVEGRCYECWVPDSLKDAFPGCFDTVP
jgi:hypothetical protein